MNELYLVRHGTADWETGELELLGREEVLDLSHKLEKVMTPNQRYRLISSPIIRAYQTAELLLPLIRKKSRTYPDIENEPDLEEMAQLDYEGLIQIGRGLLSMIKKYDDCDIAVMTSHMWKIYALAFALSEETDILLPESIASREQIDPKSKEELIRVYGAGIDPILIEPWIEIYSIGLANALYFNFQEKRCELISPD